MSTSNPRSAKPVAITLAPRSWPSWPILATRMRGRRPSIATSSSIWWLKMKLLKYSTRISYQVKTIYLFGNNFKCFLVSIFALIGTRYHRVMSHMTTENLQVLKKQHSRRCCNTTFFVCGQSSTHRGCNLIPFPWLGLSPQRCSGLERHPQLEPTNSLPHLQRHLL